MVSAKSLNQVEFVLRKTTNSEKILGGIQIVLCGDFYQLPPVANELYGDQGKHCFNAVYFDKTFPHRVDLHTVYRQTEQDLISAANELAQGSVSDATKAIILSLNRPLPAQIDVRDIVYLFCRNVDADIHNYKVITDKPGDLVTFTSEDTGDNHYLSKMLAPKHLGVKGHTYNKDQDREDLVGVDIDGDDDDDNDPSTVNTRTEGDTGQMESDSDFSEVEYDIFHIENIDSDYDRAKDILQKVAQKYKDTPLKKCLCETVKNILNSPQEFLSFYDSQYKVLASFNIGKELQKK
ncbi:uncharacterized protein LOC134238525 [Saccostrea cucullata]|uniref:uncharacterized protein LOC134238525 n=1 Tax=Saccostrea cuccullata TaxID=36930 RepID=UPI002ED36604